MQAADIKLVTRESAAKQSCARITSYSDWYFDHNLIYLFTAGRFCWLASPLFFDTLLKDDTPRLDISTSDFDLVSTFVSSGALDVITLYSHRIHFCKYHSNNWVSRRSAARSTFTYFSFSMTNQWRLLRSIWVDSITQATDIDTLQAVHQGINS